MNNNNLDNEFENAKKLRKKMRRQTFSKRRSKLDPFQYEILKKYQEDESLETIRIWLWKYKKISVVRSTIWRRIQQWMNGDR